MTNKLTKIYRNFNTLSCKLLTWFISKLLVLQVYMYVQVFLVNPRYSVYIYNCVLKDNNIVQNHINISNSVITLLIYINVVSD